MINTLIELTDQKDCICGDGVVCAYHKPMALKDAGAVAQQCALCDTRMGLRNLVCPNCFTHKIKPVFSSEA